MKKYYEMANDVFRRIEEYNVDKLKKRKRLTRSILPIMIFCLVVIFGIGAWQGDLFAPRPIQIQDDKAPVGTDNRENAPIIEPFIYLCSLKNDGNIRSDLIKPYQNYGSNIHLNFLDIKGDNETEIKRKTDDWERNIKNILSQSDAFKRGYHYGYIVLENEGYIVLRAALNYFTLNLDINDIKKIKVSNTSNYGQIDVFGTKKDLENNRFLHGKSITIDKEKITENISFSWNYDNIYEYLKENPNPSYKDFNDTFHFAIEYNDGTKKSATISIEFNELGEATIGCDGYKKIVL